MLNPWEYQPLDEADRRVSTWMERWGHRFHRYGLALMFFWFGALKIFGAKSASSLIAETIYFSSPEVMLPILGVWEIAIGFFLFFHQLARVALLLLLVRLPGTILALIFQADVAFIDFPWVPSVAGQFLIKDFLLLGAAMVIGGTVRSEQRKSGVYH